MFKLNKYILISAIFMVLIMIPFSFAEENSTDLQGINNDDSIAINTDDESQNLEVSNDEVLSKSSSIYLSPNGNDANDGSQSKPVASLNKALSLVSSGGTINVAKGHYNVNSVSITDSVKILGQNGAIFDAGNYGRILQISVPGKSVVISGIKFINGNVKDIEKDKWGGAILITNNVTGTSIMISNNQFLNNVAYAGGAIYVVDNSSGSVIIKNNVFDKCSAEFGGVISTENKVHVNIINNHFKNSFANYGAIVDYGEGSISFSKNTISNCKAFKQGDYIYSFKHKIAKNIGFSISAGNMVRGYKSGLDYKAIFYDINGKALKNYNVHFKVKGKTYKVKTDSKGVAKLYIKLNVGIHKVEITNPETGDKIDYYAFILKRIVGNKPITMIYGDGSKYTVRIIGDNGKFVGYGKIVTFKLNGKSYKVKTNKNGYASLKISLPPKKYNIKAIYKEFKVSNKIKVKPIKLYSKWWLSNGKPIVGKTVIFKVKGKVFAKVKTNKYGYAYANLKKPLKRGAYKVTANCGGKVASMKIRIK